MQYSTILIQLVLATVMAVPLSSAFSNRDIGQTSLSSRSIFVKREEATIEESATETGVTDSSTPAEDLQVETAGLDLKQNLACDGCCDDCGGCPEAATCSCPKIPCPCGWCGHLKCLCPCAFCGKKDCGGCEPTCGECGKTECACPDIPCPCEACGLLDCICPCNLCGKKDCGGCDTSCNDCGKAPCACPKFPCPCGLLKCLCSKKPCDKCGEPECDC